MQLPREFSIGEIAALIGGKVTGSSETKVKRVAMSPLAAEIGDLALVFDGKLLRRLDECKASAVIIPEGAKASVPAIAVSRPALALQRMLTAVQPRRFLPETGIHPTAVIDKTAQVDETAAIGPLVVIGPQSKVGPRTKIMPGCIIGGSVTIGEDCLFHSSCMVADYVRIGNRVVLQQGASIGSDGFGYVTERLSNLEKLMSGRDDLVAESNPQLKIPQIGNVVIEDDVEIGSNTTIDRATIGATIIGAGSKIDNLVMIAHNCRLGKECIVVALAGLAGSVTTGDRAVIAGHAGIKDHISIGEDAIVEAKAGVMQDVPNREAVVGSPAVPHRKFFESQVLIQRKLPQMYDDIKALKKQVEQLEAKLHSS
jgi:UDP-3-O-[3-hydroxymyristoyl] glucosamine N-acyltransferase